MATDHCMATTPRQPVVTLKAEVTSPDGDPREAYALLYVNGSLVDSSGANRRGRFSVDLPLNTVATLEVRMPDAVTKRLLIDTRNTIRSQDISFKLMLFRQPPGEWMEYLVPVVQIGFTGDTGEMKVHYDYQLVSRRTDIPAEEANDLGL